MAKQVASIVDKTAVVNLNSPKALAAFSKELKRFIVENHLYTEIQGKNYVHVEGWQFAGASMGLFPVIERYKNVSPEDETFEYTTKFGKQKAPVYKYTAEVKVVRLSTGEVVGYGVALCSNEEKKKNSFDEYAVLSMAQTRAVGKAFRLSIGWIMKLAGYEATTAEEAEAITSDESEEPTVAPAEVPVNDIKFLVGMKLSAMPATEKIKLLKNLAGTVNDKSLTDDNYRVLYKYLSDKERDNAESDH